MSQAAKIIIADAPLRWQDVVAVARFGAQLELSGHAWARIDNAQAIVQRIVTSGERAYGVNTGLGALCNVSLEGEQRQQRMHHLRVQAGLAVAVVDDGCADDRAGLLVAQHRAAGGVCVQGGDGDVLVAGLTVWD